MSSDTSSTYDPKIGFIINIDRVEESGDYKCRPKYPSVTNEDECVDFMVEFVDKNREFSKKKIYFFLNHFFKCLC